MLPQWIIEKKRDGNPLSKQEITHFIREYTDGQIPDYQMAALAMAIYFQGMNPAETAALTQAMMHSGEIINPDTLPGLKVDKHSTGGIGDKISLPLAPLAAACGLTVPMISGRGLGITGGTLDKLESIPGYQTDLSIERFTHILHTCGCSIIGQTPTLAPADKKLYALRDVTATVPSIPLITASIMSKKLAEGIDALVLDVKFGQGAFMKTIDEARALAHALVETGRETGRKVTALITDMNQPLGRTAGNALEVQESIDTLRGKGPADVATLTVELAAQMLHLSGTEKSLDAARALALKKLTSGAALEKWHEMLILHGATIDAPLPVAPIQRPIISNESGYITLVDADKIGRAALALGAGRTRTDDQIDPAAGIAQIVQAGEKVVKGQPLCVLHGRSDQCIQESTPLLESAFQIHDTAPEKIELIREIISTESVS